MRRTTLAVVLAVAVVALAGCAKAAEPDKAPLGIASSAVPAQASARPPGPVLIAACPLLSAALVATTLGVAAPTTNEESAPGGPAGSGYICRYAWSGGWLQVIIWVSPLSGTADQAVQHSIGRYTGTLDPVPGLGDAALYEGSSTYSTVIVARAEGNEMRLLTLITFITGNPKDKVIALARTVLDRI